MIPANTLEALRSFGYALRAERGDLVIEGPPPSSPEAMVAWLRDHKRELLALLEAESRILVLDFTCRGHNA